MMAIELSWIRRLAKRSVVVLLVLFSFSLLAQDGPLKVCATVPELSAMIRAVGGGEVDVTTFVKGSQDPHFLEARPSFIKALSVADLYLQCGLELESAWAPALLENARNGKVLPGAKGYLDASSVITPRGVAEGGVDRSLGHVHPMGNPHFLLDPVNGLKVARAIRDRLIAVRPEKKKTFEERHEVFSRRLKDALVGEKLAKKYDPEKIATLAEYGKLEEFLESQKDSELLGGWLGRMAPLRGTRVVAEHNTWPYFSERFGLEVIGFLEPKPGISPTTKHLLALVKEMKARGARGILTVPYFDRRHSRFVAQETGASVIPLAHQVGARPETDDYIAMIEKNVWQIENALKVER